ncbi:MAG: hypothetical protein N2247_04865 [Leptospiraceae bacterium]|nr:hypothetical protein [Leptospiraceae bacterium]
MKFPFDLIVLSFFLLGAIFYIFNYFYRILKTNSSKDVVACSKCIDSKESKKIQS